MADVAELSEVALRKVWPREASDFTPWLAENLPTLGSALGMDLELIGTEERVGDFAVDLLARELNSNRVVVIENQLDPTNHDHLGKVLTYAAGHNAGVLVWIAQDFRDEHRQAVDWLNQHTDPDTDFFGIEIQLLRIDDSRPAFNFAVVARPNSWQKSRSAATRGTPSDRDAAYAAFFQPVLDKLRDVHRLTRIRKAGTQSWQSFTTGIPRIAYVVSFAQGGRARVEIYIDTDSQERNKRVFDRLHSDRGEIEAAIGAKLSWERLDDNRASRIAMYRAGSIDMPQGEWEPIQQWMVQNTLKLRDVIVTRLRSWNQEPVSG